MRKPLSTSPLCLLFALAVAAPAFLTLDSGTRPAQAARGRIPVILDTDIGDDIDDTWALGLLLKSPELDVRLVIGDEGKPLYRAKLLAKLLQAAGRTDIPVGVGIEAGKTGDGPQAPWVRDYDLASYPGKVHQDGVQALIDTIMRSREPVTLIAIGPLPNIAAALEREPRIAAKARFVGMHGSVRVGYGGSKKPAAEYNVKQDAPSCRKALSAAWDVTITPLDTCGIVDLSGERYQRVRQSRDPLTAAVIENYRIWSAAQTRPGRTDPWATRSSTLFDTVAIYLGFSERLLKMERLPIEVTDAGFTVIQPGAKQMSVATEWRDLDAFRDWMVDRLLGPTVRR